MVSINGDDAPRRRGDLRNRASVRVYMYVIRRRCPGQAALTTRRMYDGVFVRSLRRRY